VVDGDAEALLDGLDQLAGAAVEGGVDLGRPVGAGHGDVQVARDRQHGGVPGLRHQVGDDDDVATLPARLPEPAAAQTLAGVGADHQQVDRAVVGGPAEAGHVHRPDLAEPEGGVGPADAGRDQAEHQQDGQGGGDPAAAVHPGRDPGLRHHHLQLRASTGGSPETARSRSLRGK
jgi:hypothetical protein